MEEKIIDGELSCNNCLGKTRCKQQQKAKEQRINAILSYIANNDNKKYIAELKNEIPAITRCDIILEKQLKRNEKLREELATERLYNSQIEEFEESLHKLKEENEEYIQTIQKFMDNAGIECDDDEQELRTLPNAGTYLFKLRLENDDLKQTIKDLTQSLDDCNVQRTQLKKENEELKEEYQQAHDDFITSDACLRIANTEKDKLEHALEEIKKLTVIGINASQCNCGLRALADDILQIISEVENER